MRGILCIASCLLLTVAADTALEKVGWANNVFALEMYGQITNTVNSEENVFYSPISVTTALAMTYAGAREETASQMQDVLNFDHIGSDSEVHAAFKLLIDTFNEPGKNYTLSLANRMFGQRDFEILQEFIDLLATYYNATMERLDFIQDTEASRVHINDWVEEKTEDKIQDLLSPGDITQQTVLVLVNAVYFKGKWRLPFNASKTVAGDFHLSQTENKQVDMMTLETVEFQHGESAELDAQILELPYMGDVAMYILLPNNVTGLSHLETTLSLDTLSSTMDSMQTTVITKLQIPKFTFRYKLLMNQLLMDMGMVDMFVLGQANFTGISTKEDLYVSKVVHEAFVEVNEEGTEAAAATAVIIDRETAQPPAVTFIANRPFLFFIREKTSGSILFMGRVVEPNTGSEDPDITTVLSTSATEEPSPATMPLYNVVLLLVTCVTVLVRTH